MDNYKSGGHSVCTNQRIVIKKKPVKAVLISLSIMGLFILLQFVVSFPYYFVMIVNALADNKMDSALAYNSYISHLSTSGGSVMITFITTLLSAVVAVICYRVFYCKKYPFEKIKNTCRQVFNVKNVVGLFFGAVCTFCMATILNSLMVSITPAASSQYNELMDLALGNINSFPLFFCLCILAPINEECIMRGIVLSKLRKNMPAAATIIICAVLFGIFHMNLIQGVYVLPCGALLAYLAYKYDSIIPSMLVHGIFNGMNYIIQLFPDEILESPFFVIGLTLVSGIAWFLLEGRNRVNVPEVGEVSKTT